MTRAPRPEETKPSSASVAEPALRLVPGSDSPFPEQLYVRLAPTVNKLLWTLLGPDPERDDLAHEIFLRILKNADKLREPERMEAWAARVTINAVKNEFRKRKLRRLVSFGLSDDDDRRECSPDFEGRELLLRTRRVLEMLPTRESLPLTLHLFGQQSAEEIAVALECSLSTVKRRLRAGKARFARLASTDSLLSERLKGARLDEDSDG